MHWIVCSGEKVADEGKRRRGGRKEGMKTRNNGGWDGAGEGGEGGR